ncbi:hemolysin family protein [Metabacillus fastidiosus]|uniref:Hemolysin family protein n=1 Tax=Metabacillus fastidiosus TaxID=1458 RepID=A0ABU6P6A3_9BACI|nr:hemolysin family protein [Metabacillus fastidiosus]MED4403706.1 hemolysin family protein [Metabacillus fastidiosus]MED4463568.1 hemolysin family protein [Metabacillus fastidiosus]
MDIVNLLLVAILIALTAFFVASEFAIVKVRGTRIDQLIAEGNKQAITAKKVIDNLDGYLSACQLGITVTALGLGWLGQPTIVRLLSPLFERYEIPSSFSQLISFAIAFSLMTFLHVVVGELAPKTLAIQKSEKLTLWLAKPLILFYILMYPFIWALNGSARFITGLFGLKPVSEHDAAHSEEELRIILSESYERGEINQSEFKYVNKIFEFDNRIAKEIMVPRTEIITLSIDEPIKEQLNIVKNEKYTRYPVVDGDKDHIIGLVNVKEVFTELVHNKDSSYSIETYIRPIIQVYDSIPIHELLLKMQTERIHMAILIDEYGGTAGLVTVEDILEEIVGEIRDEFDTDEVPLIQKITEDQYIIDGKVLVSEINDLFNLNIDDTDVDTIGGWVMTERYDVQKDEIIELDDFIIRVSDMENHHIRYLEITKKQMDEQPEPIINEEIAASSKMA